MCWPARRLPTRGLTRLELVSTMHQRKARMAELADAFLILPGGYGTLEELLEVVTWAQLALHAKPCILINTAGYWDGLLDLPRYGGRGRLSEGEKPQPASVADTARNAVGIAKA